MTNRYKEIAEMIFKKAEKDNLDVRDLIRNWIELFESSRVVGFSREEFMDACIEAQTPKEELESKTDKYKEMREYAKKEMKEEESLSSKRWGSAEENDWNYDEEELKDAIKRIMKDLHEIADKNSQHNIELGNVAFVLDKVFGPKLTNVEEYNKDFCGDGK